MDSLKKILNKTLEVTTGTLLLVMVAIATWQVLSRYILNAPSTTTEEFLRYSLIWISMLAAAYAVGKKGHIAITFLSDRFKYNKKLMIDIIIQAGFLFFAAVIMVYGGGKAVSLTTAQISPSLNISMSIIYLSLPVSGVLIILYSLINLTELLRDKGKLNKDSR